MSKLLGGLWCAAFLAFLLLCAPARAANASKKIAAPLYDVSKEVTLEGNVTTVSASVPGNVKGGHIFVSTSKGTIDGHLGPFALAGKNSISVPAGSHVKLVGVMATVGGRQVFLVRTIDTGSTKYTIRSEHGFPLIPNAVQPTKSINFVNSKGGR